MRKKDSWTHLLLEERQILYTMIARGVSLRAIAKILDRSPGTLSKELKRNWGFSVRAWQLLSPLEKAAAAHKRAQERASQSRSRERYRGILREVSFQRWMVERLSVDKWSLETVANSSWRFRPDSSVSTSTLYRFVKAESRNLIQFLPRRGKKYRRHLSDRKSVFRGGTPIAKRPDIEGEFGHIEIDAVVSSKHQTSILSLRERESRLAILSRVPDLKSQMVKNRIHGCLANLPTQARKTVTHDNGSEFAAIYQLERSMELQTYRCDPYASWQRGSVENLNGLLRRFYPKGTDFRTVSDEELKEVERKINDRPMKCLKWKTPTEVFNELSC